MGSYNTKHLQTKRFIGSNRNHTFSNLNSSGPKERRSCQPVKAGWAPGYNRLRSEEKETCQSDAQTINLLRFAPQHPGYFRFEESVEYAEYYVPIQHDFRYYDGVKSIKACVNVWTTRYTNIHIIYEQHLLSLKIDETRTIKRDNSISHTQPSFLPFLKKSITNTLQEDLSSL